MIARLRALATLVVLALFVSAQAQQITAWVIDGESERPYFVQVQEAFNAAFAGVSPRRHESGSSVRARTSMCKAGNPTVRAALYMSAVTTARLTAGMRDVYTRLITNGKAPKSALGALMRKQLILMRALLVRGEDYRPPVEKSPHERAKNLVS